MQPHEYPRRVFLAVTGLSPQVVTETLYALFRQVDPPFVPTEIHLLTTSEGAERARLSLLHDEIGWFRRFCADYELPEIRFDSDSIHVIRDPSGGGLEDIRTPLENEHMADQIIEQVRRLTLDDETALHVSIAGGRKTMGFYLGYALSLYGRPQDRLSHVLVEPPFESHPDFFYPTPASRIIYSVGPDSKPLDTSKARVTLAEIPFVRLRHGLDERLTEGDASFSEVVASAQIALGPARLVIDLEGKCVDIGGKIVPLAPAQLAFLSWFARRRVAGKPPIRCPADGVADRECAEEYLREYAEIADPETTGTGRRLSEGMHKTFFEQTKSRLHAALRRQLGPEGSGRYGIRKKGRLKGYELEIEPGEIEWRFIEGIRAKSLR